jgi:DHA1 family bicyclomycin/chloramphenicol resistance-like MFS transporter
MSTQVVASRIAHLTWLPTLLGLFIAVGPAATDMYLPAFPAVEATFGTAPGTAQLTLATWFAGLAVGQITRAASLTGSAAAFR